MVVRTLLALALAASAAASLPAPAGAVFHGTPVPAAETPWLVTFMARDVACGGTLIAPDRVLTAAHCVQGVGPGSLRIRVGGGELGTTRVVGWKGAAFPASYRLVPSPSHPEDPALAAAVNDVAVVVLDRKLTGVPVAPLETGGIVEGEATLTVGRGRTGAAAAGAPTGGPSHVALGAAQVVETEAACRTAYGSLLSPSRHLCTIDRSASAAQACAGDSGSPVLVRRLGVLAVAGVVSWGGETRGRDCGEGLPDVSERVAPHQAFLAGRADVFAPWAERRVRVRRIAGGRLRCVIGDWGGSRATFRVRWWKPGARRTEQDPETGVTRMFRTAPTPVPGTGETRRDGAGRLGCTVTATNAGGWAAEDAYNAL